MPRMLDLEVEFISLVKRGANRLRAVYKTDAGTITAEVLQKFDEERGELLNVVYAPEQRDTQGDIASAEVIKRAMEGAAQKGGPKIDMDHDGVAIDPARAFVSQSFLVGKGDERFQGWTNDLGQVVNLENAWATVIKIEDEALRARFRTGELGAVSLGGKAVMVDDGHEATDRSKGMDWGKLSKIVDESVEKAIGKAVEVEGDYEVDLSDPASVEKHLKLLKQAKAAEKVDLTCAKSVAAHLATLKQDDEDDHAVMREEKQDDEEHKAKADDDQGEDAEVAKSEAKIAELEKQLEEERAAKQKAVKRAKKLAASSKQGDDHVDLTPGQIEKKECESAVSRITKHSRVVRNKRA